MYLQRCFSAEDIGLEWIRTCPESGRKGEALQTLRNDLRDLTVGVEKLKMRRTEIKVHVLHQFKRSDLNGKNYLEDKIAEVVYSMDCTCKYMDIYGCGMFGKKNQVVNIVNCFKFTVLEGGCIWVWIR